MGRKAVTIIEPQNCPTCGVMVDTDPCWYCELTTKKGKRDSVFNKEFFQDGFFQRGFLEEPKLFLKDKKVKIQIQAFEKMYYYALAAPGEVSGLGKAIFKGNDIIVTDVMILKQQCNGAHTTLDAEMLSKFVVELVREGKKVEAYNLWWHSHNDFGASWSGEDEANIRRLTKNTKMLSICINKMGEMVARVDRKGKSEDLFVTVASPDNEKIMKQCYKEVKEKVSEEKFDEMKMLTDKEIKKLSKENTDGLYAPERLGIYAQPW